MRYYAPFLTACLILVLTCGTPAHSCSRPPLDEGSSLTTFVVTETQPPTPGKYWVFLRGNSGQHYETVTPSLEATGCAVGISISGNTITSVDEVSYLDLDGLSVPTEGFYFEPSDEVTSELEGRFPTPGRWSGFMSPGVDGIADGKKHVVRFSVTAREGLSLQEVELDLRNNFAVSAELTDEPGSSLGEIDIYESGICPWFEPHVLRVDWESGALSIDYDFEFDHQRSVPVRAPISVEFQDAVGNTLVSEQLGIYSFERGHPVRVMDTLVVQELSGPAPYFLVVRVNGMLGAGMGRTEITIPE